jgi:hypothetical protein
MPLPSTPESAARPVLTVQFPPAIYARILADGRDQDRTPSYMVRAALVEHYEWLDGKPLPAEDTAIRAWGGANARPACDAARARAT